MDLFERAKYLGVIQPGWHGTYADLAAQVAEAEYELHDQLADLAAEKAQMAYYEGGWDKTGQYVEDSFREGPPF